MILYSCDKCGLPFNAAPFYVTAHVASSTYVQGENHFCSVTCLTEWANLYGFTEERA